MRNLNNKGFTLVELIATIVILVLVMGIGSYAITELIQNSKEKDYQLLIGNIDDAVLEYYMECKYGESSITCPTENSGYYQITLGDLVTNGFLKGNSTDSNDNYILVNPNDRIDISGCSIRYKYSDGKIMIEAVSLSGSCPSSY